MSLKDILNDNMVYWGSRQGPEGDVVLSSRIRLARNLEDIPYPNKAGREELERAKNMIIDALGVQNIINLHSINMEDLPEVEREVLVEKNIISPDHAINGVKKGLLLNDDETVSIMINEEDHIRVQVLSPGLELDNTWKLANELDDLLESKLNFAFSDKRGYLSACPTNAGTGLRASVMVHLPALNLTNNVAKLLGAVSQLGLAVRGIYGERSEFTANIYQISNQITLGHTEEDIIDNLKSVTNQIIEQERKARKFLLNEEDINVRDKIKRAYGILKYAHKISSEEAIRLLSDVRLGIDMEIIDGVDPRVLSDLMVLIRPAHLQKLEGRELSTIERDLKRAELIQYRLNM